MSTTIAQLKVKEGDDDEITVFERAKKIKPSDYGELEIKLPTEEETEAFLRTTELPGGATQPNSGSVNRWILFWHFSHRFMEEMWFFLIPLLLMKTFGDSLIPPAIYFFFNKLICLLFASNLGAWLDQQPRASVLNLATFGQMFSVALSSFFLCIMMYQIQDNSKLAWNFLGSISSGVLFLSLTIISLIGSLASFALRKSIEKDWLPAVTPVIQLVSLRRWMSGFTFIAELLAPLITATILVNANLVETLLTIGCLYFASFIPQWIALRRVLTLRPQLQRPGTKSEIQDAMLNPFGVIYRGFSVFRKQRVLLVILASTFIHFSVLNIRNPVVISYLAYEQLNPIYIALFAAASSLFGSSVINAPLYTILLGRLGLFATCNLFLIFQVLMLIISGVTFSLQQIYPFLVFLFLSVSGNYAFKMCKIQVMEKGVVNESSRKTVDNVDTAFVHLAQMLGYLVVLIVGDPLKFGAVVWSSFSFVLVGILLFWLWSCSRNNRNAIILG